ncbi:MAG: metallopeptidase TldD-related protein [Candidatus Hodarchaeota archaeon]
MSEQIIANTDLAINVGQGLDVDLIIGKGIESINNQIRFSQNKIDINKQWQTSSLELFVVVEGNQLAVVEFSPTTEEEVRNQVESLVKFALKMPPSPFFQGIEERKLKYSLVPGIFDSKIDDFRQKAPQYVNASIDAAIAAGAKRAAGSFLFGQEDIYTHSSAGPQGKYSRTFYNLTIRGFQAELDASGQGLTCGPKPSIAEKELTVAGERAGHFSKLHQGAHQAKPGKYDIVMAPAVAANLLGKIPAMANPVSIMMGMSALGDKMGEKLAPEFVSVSDNGLKSGGLASSPFDFEGTTRQKTSLIRDGILINFIHNTSSANMFQGESTGNGELLDLGSVWGGSTGSKILIPAFTNIIFNDGDHSLDELLEGSTPTVFVTCNWYTRFTSRISTEFSTIPRDAAFLIERGELGKPLKNFRISDNLLRQFTNIEAIGNDRVQVKWWEVLNPTWISTVRVKDCRITTATQ